MSGMGGDNAGDHDRVSHFPDSLNTHEERERERERERML